jgi:hypothetical protein
MLSFEENINKTIEENLIRYNFISGEKKEKFLEIWSQIKNISEEVIKLYILLYNEIRF